MIPFTVPSVMGQELEYLQQVLNSTKWGGDGAFTGKCEKFLESQAGAKKALLTTSCTDALEMSALLLEIKDGDEVICPSYTFVTSINAFVMRGAKPVFVDIRPDTLNIDENLIEAKITKKTKAIVVVHYAGVACEMDAILKIADSHKIAVVEDNAHGLFGKYNEKVLGTMGRMSTLSFHETKNFSCGEGGALMLNRAEDIERAEILREKGTNRRRFLRGQVDKYTWVDLGSSFLPSEFNAAVLLAQFEKRKEIETIRGEIWRKYVTVLNLWAKSVGAKMPTIPEYATQTYHMFYLIMPSLRMRTEFIDHLKALKVSSVFHYQSLHLSDMGKKYGGKEGDCPVTERVSDCLVRLPLFNSMKNGQIDDVITAVMSFQPQ